VLLSVAAIALSAWQGGLSRDSLGAHRSVALLGIAALVAMVVLGWGRQRQGTRMWAMATVHLIRKWRSQPKANVVSILVWSVLIVGVIGWDLLSFALQSPSFPTLSTLVGHVSRYPVGRGLLFAGWLAVGWYVAAGCRAGSRR
jgi:type IV secretory pathway TrbD component